MKKIIKTISEVDCKIFDKEVQKCLDEEYRILSVFCGLEHYCDGSTEPIYKAILLKED